jgi:hypothetical protein
MKEPQLTIGTWEGVDFVWLEAPITDDWTGAYRLLIQDGMPVIGEVRIFPTENTKGRQPGEWSIAKLGNLAIVPKGGLTISLLREVKLGIVRTKIAAALELFRQRVPELLVVIHFVPRESKPEKKRNEKRGRPRTPDNEYLKIADN